MSRSAINRRCDSRHREAFSIVELLVVLSVIGLLLSLLIPALGAAREGARTTSCSNNLRQLGTAVSAHVSAFGHYPTGGWGYAWVGDPDLGYGPQQPGGWLYNVLPFLEEQALRQEGKGLSASKKHETLGRVTQVQLQVVLCPTRRGGDFAYGADVPPLNAAKKDTLAKSDYAINAGQENFYLGPGPPSIMQSRNFPWPAANFATGISYQRSKVRPRHVQDGQSKTYMLGEKYVSSLGIDRGHDQSMYSGHDFDMFRWTGERAPPLFDSESSLSFSFGSAHGNGFNMLFCDLSSRFVPYSVDLHVHAASGNRSDGN